MEKEKEFDTSILWKLLAVLVIGILIGIFTAKYVHAATWPLNKDATCNLFNLTGTSCDAYWCDEIIECNYNTSLTACICTQQNTTTIVVYQNGTSNETNSTTPQLNTSVDPDLKNYTDSQIRELRDSILDRLDNQSAPYQQTQQRTQLDLPWWALILGIGIICGTLIYLSWQNTNKKKLPNSQQFRRHFRRPSEFQQSNSSEATYGMNPNDKSQEEKEQQ